MMSLERTNSMDGIRWILGVRPELSRQKRNEMIGGAIRQEQFPLVASSARLIS